MRATMNDMWFRARRRERLAKQAAEILISEALISIRSTASLGRVSPGQVSDRAEADPQRWVHLLADIVHNLPPAIGPSMKRVGQQRYLATWSINYLWKTSSPIKRSWIAATLRRHSIDMELLLGDALTAPSEIDVFLTEHFGLDKVELTEDERDRLWTVYEAERIERNESAWSSYVFDSGKRLASTVAEARPAEIDHSFAGGRYSGLLEAATIWLDEADRHGVDRAKTGLSSLDEA